MITAPALRAYTSPPSRITGDTVFRGMDARLPAERLADGFAQRAENLCLTPGGSWISRPPFAGQFTTPLPGPLYSCGDRAVFHTAANQTRVVFGAGNGRLYYFVPGANVPVEITRTGGASANVSFATFRCDRFGKWLYFLDATGALCRTDTLTIESPTGLDAPVSAPVATLTSRVLNAFNNAAVWAADTISGGNSGNAQANPSFDATTAGTRANAADSTRTAITGWLVTSGYVDVLGDNSIYGAGRHYVLLQQAGTSMQSADWYAMPALTNANGVGSVARYAKHVKISVNGFFKQAPDSLLLEILGNTAADGSGTTSVSPAFAASAQTTAGQGAAIIRAAIADLSQFGVEIRAFKLRVTGGPTNQTGASGPYGTDFVAAPFEMDTTFSASANGLTVYGNLPNATNPKLPFGGKILSIDLAPSGSPTDRPDFSSYANLTIPLSTANFTDPAALRLRLGFRATGAATRYTTNLVTVSEDFTSLSVDISTVPTINRNSVRYIDLVFDSDAPVANALPAGQNALFTIGALTDAGRLSVIGGIGEPYTYRTAYYRADTGAIVTTYAATPGLESSGSPFSNQITPTTKQAQALVTAPDVPPAGTTHVLYFRFGGVFTDGLGRLLAFAPVGTDTTSAAGWSWDSVNRVLRDNVPDSALLSVLDFYQNGRDKPPTGITDLVVHDFRLWLAAKNTLYASWLLSSGDTNALYFTYAADGNDPRVEEKGQSFSLASSFDTDAINSLFSHGTILLPFRQQSVNIVAGDNANNFTVREYQEGSGAGCIARAGVCKTRWSRVWYLAAGGVDEFAESGPTNVSAKLKPILSLGAIGATDYAKAALCAHDDCVFVFVQNVAYVYNRPEDEDGQADGEPSWTVWSGTPFSGATGAVSVATTDNGHDLYVCGGDGQMYKLAGRYGQAVAGGDTATPAATGTPIATTLRTGRHAAPGNENQKPNALFFDVETDNPSGEQLTLSIYNSPTNLYQQIYNVAQYRNRRELQSVGYVLGAAHEIRVSASVSYPFRVYGAELRVSGAGVRHG